jgi:hypothetical protein
MNFFCTKKHFETYVQQMGLDERHICGLNLETALIAARMLFTETEEEANHDAKDE